MEKTLNIVGVLLLGLCLISCGDSLKQEKSLTMKPVRRSVFDEKLFHQVEWMEFALKHDKKVLRRIKEDDTLSYLELNKMVCSYYVDNNFIWVVNYAEPYPDSTAWDYGGGFRYLDIESNDFRDFGVSNQVYKYVYDIKSSSWSSISAPFYVDNGFYLMNYINLEYDGGRKLIPDSTQIVKYGWSSAEKDTLRERLKSAREFVKTHNTDFPFEDVIDDTIKFKGELFY